MFNKKILNKYLSNLDEIEVSQAFSNLGDFKSSIKNIKEAKEEQYQAGFLNDLFVKALGYVLFPKENYDLTTELKNETDSKKADGAILKDNKVIAIIELKSIKTKSMENIVNQAFNYKNNHPTCKYIITSNFAKLRLYIEYSNEFIEFDLFNLSFEDFKVLYLLLSKKYLLDEDLAYKIKKESKEKEELISNEFYKEYSDLRLKLFENIRKNNNLDEIKLLNLTQKILDRLIFVFFAEDRFIIENKTIENLIKQYKSDFLQNSLFMFIKSLFNAINSGNERVRIFAYNGGLFVQDLELDNLKIDDKVLLEVLELNKYDFDSELDVDILGHIFENSLSDLEELKSLLTNKEFDKKATKRKKDGVFYTPNYITKYITENTLGKICFDKKSELNLNDFDDTKIPTKEELEALKIYKDFLMNLKIIDPACGSGAFLIEAFNFLECEYRLTFNLINKSAKNLLQIEEFDLIILENNLFGVDINHEAVEISKLSLWLKTGKRERKLTNLNNNLICANSLLNMPFELNHFDVVVGNPPYVRQESIKEFKAELEKVYSVYSGTADLYVYFYELAFKLLKDDRIFGFICSNKFFRAKYGEKLREFILKNLSIETIVDFNGVKVFESATVDSAITILKKTKANNKEVEFKFVNSNLKDFSFISQLDLDKSSFNFANKKELEIRKKIEKIGTSLKEWDIKINFGIKTGFNEAFIIDEKTKDEIIKKDSKSAEIIKPILRGRDIKRYSYEFANLYLINTHNNPPIEIENYPAIKEHLDKFYPQLEKRTDKGKTPYHLRSCAYYDVFEKEKIVYSEIVQEPQFYLNGGKFLYGEATTFIMTGKYLKYLISLLHSKLITFAFKKFYMGTELGSKGIRYKKAFVEKLPIPQISEKAQEPFIKLVDEIINSKEKIKKYKKHFDSLNITEKIELKEEIEKLEKRVIECENEIDKMVYKLYELSEEEIKIVSDF